MFQEDSLCVWMLRAKYDIIILAKAVGGKAPKKSQMMKPLQGKTCEGFSIAQNASEKQEYTISKEREDLPMRLEKANNRPVLMNPKHPVSVRTWDCGGSDASVVRIMEGQTGGDSCKADHPQKNVQKAKKRFRRIKGCHARDRILRSEGDKYDEDF